MKKPTPNLETTTTTMVSARHRSRRHRRLIIVVLGILATAFIALEVMIQRAPALQTPVSNTVLLHSITWLNVILVLVVLFVLGRDLVKMYVDRRENRPGSKFRVKLVVTYLGLILVPSVILFFVASDMIRRSVDQWFSTSVQEVTVRSRELVRQATQREEEELLRLGHLLAAEVTGGRILTLEAWQVLRRDMSERLTPLMLDVIAVYENDAPLIDPVIDDSGELAVSQVDLNIADAEITLALNGQTFVLEKPLEGERTLLLAGVPIRSPTGREVAGVLVAGRVWSDELAAHASAIENIYQSTMASMTQKEPVKLNYVLTFLLITLLIVFGAVWVGLYLARGVTVPIQLLAEGTRAVASGNLDHSVEVSASDELGMLVESFNQMTRDLRASQGKLDQSRRHLERTVTELDERRGYMEAVLANIATGVVSMNASGEISTFNEAAQLMLGLDAQSAIDKSYEVAFAGDNFRELRALMRRVRPGVTEVGKELGVETGGQRLTIAAHCTSLRDSAGEQLGTVVVLDDLTELIRAQKTSAWREVARRIAHEIRNPLTPIQLSAQRIARRYRRAAGAEHEYDLIDEGTRTILQEVNTLKGLVEEFSRFARMPSASPVLTGLHPIIEDSLLPYATTHAEVRIVREFANGLPDLNLDPDQMRRSFTNLFDNAVEAMKGKGRLTVSTAFDPDLHVARIEIADSGPGIRAKDKDRLFLPYFSRRRGGTGLGLAIVHQIISDHRGYVRVADNLPFGARFIVELPV